MADKDRIEGHAEPTYVDNMANAPAVVDPARRGGGKDQGETGAGPFVGERDRKRHDDKIIQGASADGAHTVEDFAPMDDRTLLDFLAENERDASDYATGPLRQSRESTIRAYFQQPYGNEEEGWSQYVSSVVAETVEWMLPDLLDVFMSTDKAVEFTPTRADQEQPAADATAGVNYVFHEQNNGFLILYTAIKDMLTVKTCAIHWFGLTTRKRCRVPFRNATQMDIAMLMKPYAQYQPQVDHFTVSEAPAMGPGGMPLLDPQTLQPHMQTVYTGSFTYVEKKKRVRVEAFEPENLGVLRSWTSPLLDECPYVVRWIEISLSDLNQLCDDLGVDRVSAEDLASSQAPVNLLDDQYRRDRSGNPLNFDGRPARPEGVNRDDPSQTMGWLRVEWVLVDYDGDGIAERREIWRLDDVILYNEECEGVPVCTGSPILIPHRWDGQSVGETMEDLQLLDTELTRGVINNAYASNNPRKVVLTDKNGAPYADTGDLVDGRPGGLLRVTQVGAVTMEPTEYVGHYMEPLLSRVDQLRETRSGVTKQRMGLNPNAIRTDRTLGEAQMVDNASQKRVKLIARVICEIVLKPTFQGIKGLLTSGDYEELFFKLRGRYVSLNPNDWRDSYDMKTNVGLGTGDAEQQKMDLRGISDVQRLLMQTPLGPGMVRPRQIYNAIARRVELSGFKNVGEFFDEPPEEARMPQPQPQPPWQLQVEEMKLKQKQASEEAERAFEMAKIQLEARNNAQSAADTNNVQMQNDMRDAMRQARESESREQLDALRLIIDKYKIDTDRETKLEIARLQSDKTQDPPDMNIDPSTGKPFDPMQPVLQKLQEMFDSMNAPLRAVHDPVTGDVTGVQRGNGPVRPVRRENGRVVGLD